MFSEVKVYDVVISGLHQKTYVTLRKLYELALSRRTAQEGSAIYNSENREWTVSSVRPVSSLSDLVQRSTWLRISCPA